MLAIDRRKRYEQKFGTRNVLQISVHIFVTRTSSKAV